MKLFFPIVLLAGLTACGAGSGDGLDAQGLPVTDNNGGTPPEPGVTLTQLQQTIFGGVCTNCHTGANAPRGLRLDSEENSYQFLVNRAADESPSLMRVNPGKPDDSYLIKKLEGSSDIVGARMPLGGPYLSQAQIDQVRSWIANGAARTGTGTATTKVARASAEKLSPAQNAAPVTVDLHFSRAVQFDSISPETISVFYRNATDVKTVDDFSLLLDGQTLQVTVRHLPADAQQLEVRVNDNEITPLLDESHQALDGDADEHQGGGYRYVYSL